MADIRRDLISWYASNKVVDANSSNVSYVSMCKAHASNRFFDQERQRIETAKRRLESKLDTQVCSQDQLKGALTELLKARKARSATPGIEQIYYDLLVTGYSPNWTAIQRQYFESCWKLIKLNNDFFLSFTTRNSVVGSPIAVNSRYRFFIRRIIGDRRIKTADHSRANLLAEAIYQLLTESLNRGFMFTLHENDNTVTEQKLRDACSDSVVFIQIVQNIMFEPPAHRKNYCYFEYEEAIQTVQEEHRILFIIAEDALVANLKIPQQYEKWYEHISRKDPPYLDEVSTPSFERVNSLQNKIKKKVVSLLDEIWFQMINGVPA
jgi:hypothetical protein